MENQEVKWEYYPLVAGQPETRAFVERLVLKGKRPKTVDAYARAIEDLFAYFSKIAPERLIEADEADLDGYIASLKGRGPKKRGRGGMIEDNTKIRHLSGRKLSDNTIAQRIVACRLFYDFLIRKGYRSDPINPIERGSDGRDGRRPVRGPVTKHQRLPWLPPDEVWEDFIHHLLSNEGARTQAMILLCYDAALRREELMSLRSMISIGRTRSSLSARTRRREGECGMCLSRRQSCTWCVPIWKVIGEHSSLPMVETRMDPSSCQNQHVTQAALWLLVRLMRSWNRSEKKWDCQPLRPTHSVTNVVRSSKEQESAWMILH